MGRSSCVALVCGVLLLAAGCGGSADEPDERAADRVVVELHAVVPDPAVAPSEACLAATADYGLLLVADAVAGSPACSRLRQYLPGEAAPEDRALPSWDDEEVRFRAPPFPDDPQDLGTVVCEARRRTESVLVARIGEDRVPDLERLCDGLAEDRWVVTRWRIGSSEK